MTTTEEIKSQLFIEQDSQFMISRTFLKKADPYLNYNSPDTQIILAFLIPLVVTFLWLCIPLTGSPTTQFFLFAFVFQPIMVTFHCILLWYLLSLYLPTPSNRTKFFAVLMSLAINVLVLLNILWLETYIHGTKIVIVLAISAICIPIFVVAYFHCKKVMRLGKLGKSDVLSGQAIERVTDLLGGEETPIYEKPNLDGNLSVVQFLKAIFSRTPNDSVLVPWKPASLKKRCWSIFIGIVLDIGIYVFLIVYALLVYKQDPAWQIFITIGMYLVEIGIHKSSSAVSTKLDEDLCFEIPQHLLHSFFIDLIFYSFNRNVLFMSVNSYITFGVWQLAHVADDLFAGIFTYFSYSCRNVPLIGKCSIPNVEEVKEVVCMQYYGKKMAQFFSNVALILFMFLLKYYWNSSLFPYATEQHMEMLVAYSVCMFILDISTGALSFFLIHRDMEGSNKTYIQLIRDLYSYPRVGVIIGLLSLLSLQYTYTAIFFTQRL